MGFTLLSRSARPGGADAAKDLCGRLTEQAGEQGNEDDADERHAAARHELFYP